MNLILSNLQNTDLKRFCALRGLGELTPEQVRQHAPDALITLDIGGMPAARLSLWWRNVPDSPAERLGLIGHYSALNGKVAAQILEAACQELTRHGCTLAVGPMDGSTWRRYRLLTERGEEPPFFLEPDNPDDWPYHFEAQGFAPLALYYSALNDDIRRPWPLPAGTRAGFDLRTLDPARMDQELHSLWDVARRAFAANFLYTPIGESEFLSLYRPLLPQLQPEFVLMAEQDDTPVAFCFAVPDLLQAWRGLPVDTLIIKTIAVLPEYQGRGLGTLLIARVNEAAARLGMRRSIHALMHEANPSRRIGKGFMREFRRYTLFARRL